MRCELFSGDLQNVLSGALGIAAAPRPLGGQVIRYGSRQIEAQARAFATIGGATSAMLASNQKVKTAAGQTEAVARSAQDDMAGSRTMLEEALEAIGSLAEIVTQIRSDAEAWR